MVDTSRPRSREPRSRVSLLVAATTLCGVAGAGALVGATALGARAISETRVVADSSPGVRTRIVREGLLPLAGADDVHVRVTEVVYAPGAASPPHSHDCAIVAYIAAGTLRSQSGDDAVAVYAAGDAFLEAPGQVHRVSANASRDVPATLIATSVCGRAGARDGR